MNEAYDHVVGLRAVRDFRDDPLKAEDLEDILEAARWTGSSKNKQAWSFIVIDDPAQRDAVAGCGSFTGPMRKAPVTIALVEERGGYRFDTGRVAQNIMLAADAIGVASCPVTLHNDDKAAEVLGLPAAAHCRFAVALGYPADTIAPSRYGGRKPLDELVHHNRYGD